MRIMIDASVCSVGGGVQVALNFLANIAYDKAFEVICVASPQLDAQLSNMLKQQLFAYIKEENVSIFKKGIQGKRLSNIESKYKPDFVFVVFGPSYWRPKAKTLQGFALPLLVYPQTRNRVYQHQYLKLIYQKLLNSYKARMTKNNADHLVVETYAFRQRCHEVLGIPLDKIHVVENSFNLNFIEEQFNLGKINKETTKTNFFIPSAYYPHKNLEILVEVARILVDNNFNDFIFNFLISPSSKEWTEIISKAKHLKVSNKFNTYGPVKNDRMASLYSINDFVILPTLAEASTAVYPESFASNKVLLTSNLDFAKELCGQAAVYFNPYEPTDIARVVLDIVQDVERQARLIDLGRKQIRMSYVTPEEKWLKQKQLILNLV